MSTTSYKHVTTKVGAATISGGLVEINSIYISCNGFAGYLSRKQLEDLKQAIKEFHKEFDAEYKT